MSERYWITGVQLGMLRTVKTPLGARVDIVEEIIEKQFLGTKNTLELVVSLQALKEWCVEQKRLLGKHRATDAFHEGELSGSIEQLNIMLSWAEKEAGK